jgi:hypothetical protein
MSSLAFLLSTLVSKASTAVNLGFVVFVIGWIMQVTTCPLQSASCQCVHPPIASFYSPAIKASG